jgi:hypothetical protein
MEVYKKILKIKKPIKQIETEKKIYITGKSIDVVKL